MIDKTLHVFDSINIMKRTAAICLLVTKWDRYKTKNKENDIREFVSSRYKNLDLTCKRYSKAYNIPYEIFPFSVGNFNTEVDYNFEPHFPKIIFDWLCSVTPVKDKPLSFLDKLLYRMKSQ
jgi:hypothetical protein